jgi:hypothetical protein
MEAYFIEFERRIACKMASRGLPTNAASADVCESPTATA